MLHRFVLFVISVVLVGAFSINVASQAKPMKKAEVEALVNAYIDSKLEDMTEAEAVAKLRKAKSSDVKTFIGKVIEKDEARTARALELAGKTFVEELDKKVIKKLLEGPHRLNLFNMMLSVQSKKYMEFLMERWKDADAKVTGAEFSELSDLFIRYSLPLKSLATFTEALKDEKADVARHAESANILARQMMVEVNRDYPAFLKTIDERMAVIKEASKSFTAPEYADDVLGERRRSFADYRILDSNVVIEGRSNIEFSFDDYRRKSAFTLTFDVYTIDDAGLDVLLVGSGYDWKLTSTQNAWQLVKVPSDEKLARKKGEWYHVEIVVGGEIKANNGNTGRKLSFTVNDTVIKADAVLEGEMESVQIKTYDGNLVFGRCHIK